MSAITLSAHELTKTRLCHARDCEADAEPLSMLCTRCDARWRAGKQVYMNEVVQPAPVDTATQLCCTKCGEWKTDDNYGRSTDKGPARRGRKCQCKACDTLTHREYLKNRSPEKVAAQKARDRERRCATRQRRATLSQASTNAQAGV